MFLVSSDRVYRNYQIKDSHGFLDMYVLSFPRPCLLLYSICIFIGDYSVACHRLQYGRSCTSLIKIFVSVLVFLYVNLEVSVYFSAGRKI